MDNINLDQHVQSKVLLEPCLAAYSIERHCIIDRLIEEAIISWQI